MRHGCDGRSGIFVLHAAIQVDPDRREQARELADHLVEQSNQEAGTIEYRATTDIQDGNVIRFFEQYEDEAALEAHNQTEHFRAFEEQLPELLGGEPEVTIFEVAEATELEL